jgi:hypothetical protein
MLSKIHNAFNYLFKDLPTSEKVLHHAIILWVLLQIISSSFMHIRRDTLWSDINWVSQLHIYSGLVLLFVSILFFIKVINRRKATDIYPWIYKNVNVITEDIKTLLTFRLPETRPAGLAATIEGLGLLALLLAVTTGMLWYLSVGYSDLTPLLLKTHKTSVGLIEIYFYGHGLFGLLHLINRLRSKKEEA